MGLGFLILPSLCIAQTTPVWIDGLFDDWEGASPIYTDPQGDGGGSIDFGRLWMQNDDRYVYLSFELAEEISLQAEMELVLAMDTDGDASTGFDVASIGAEFMWRFGDRIGSVQMSGVTRDVGFQDIGLVSAPTVTSSFFELSFELDADPRRLGALFPSDTVRVVLMNGTNGDQLPEVGEEAVFVIDRSASERNIAVDLDRSEETAFRLLSWNVRQDGLFESNKTAPFQRLLAAVRPDAIVFSEIFSHSAAQTLTRITQLAPPDAGERWYASAANSSVVMVSKTPIIRTIDVEPRGRAKGFVLDRPHGLESDLFVVGAHLFCCGADVARQTQVDEIMAEVRDAQNDGRLPPRTPFIFAGDMNFVGDSQQPRTLLSGEIVAPSLQPSFQPDWDGTPLSDARPRTTALPHTFTWISPAGPSDQQFSPGRLDYIIYSDAVLALGNSFALYTPSISFTVLQQLGLSATDSNAASDHLAVVADFSPVSTTASEIPLKRGRARFEMAVYPNPASHVIHVDINGSTNGDGAIEIFDVLGRRVGMTRIQRAPIGSRRSTMNIQSLPAGMYMVVARLGGDTVSQQIVKLDKSK